MEILVSLRTSLLPFNLMFIYRPLPFIDFNLDFYTEVQDLSYLENALSASSPRYAALNIAICSLIEDYGLVGFETLAVEVSFMSEGDFGKSPRSFASPSHKAERVELTTTYLAG